MSVTEDITATLRAQDHGHPPIIIFEPKTYEKINFGGRYRECEITTSLRASGGDSGGGSEVLVVTLAETSNYLKKQKLPHASE